MKGNYRIRLVSRWVAVCVLLFVAGSVAASALSDRMLILLKEGKMLEVYRLGLKNSFVEGGNVDFDYAFGIAAVRVGRPGRAIFALERVLWRQPDNHRARLELARAQFDLGNLGVARDEFREVLAQNPPANVKRNVELYLSKIKQREKAQGTVFRSFAEANLVYDSNLNAATSTTQIAVPALGWVTLDPGSIAQAGSAFDVNAGVEFESLLSKKSAVFGSLKGTSRTVMENDSLSTVSLDVSGGMMFGSRSSRLRIPVQYSQLYVAGQNYRKMSFVGLDWSRTVSKADSFTTFAQAGTMQYTTQSERNVTLGVVGASWTHRFGHKGHSFSVAGHYGQEAVENSAYPWWGRNYYGMKTGLQWRLGATDSLYASLSYQQATHLAPDPVFIVTRADQLMQLTGGWNRLIGKKTVLKAEMSLTNNNTNIDIYTYDRTQVMIGAKYQF